MNLSKFYDSILERNGGSYNIVTGEFNPTTGYMVSIKGCEQRIALDKFTREALNYYLVENIHMLCLDIYYLGAWVDNDFVYLDVSVNELKESRALKLAKTNKQIAIYDCANSVAIHV